MEVEDIARQDLVAEIKKTNYASATQCSDSSLKRVTKTRFTSQFEPDSDDKLEDNPRVNRKVRALVSNISCAEGRILREDDNNGEEGDCMYDVIRDMEVREKQVTNKAAARKKYVELTQNLGIVVRVAWLLLRKHFNQTNEVAVCGTILDPRFTIKFFQFAEFSLEDRGEIKSALYSMYDKYINEDVSENFDNENEPFGNEKEYFAKMGWLRKRNPTNSPDGTLTSAAKPIAKHQKKIRSLLSEEENSCNNDNNNDDDKRRNRNGNTCNQNQVPANTQRVCSTRQTTELQKKKTIKQKQQNLQTIIHHCCHKKPRKKIQQSEIWTTSCVRMLSSMNQILLLTGIQFKIKLVIHIFIAW
jgi:hypothetical protein